MSHMFYQVGHIMTDQDDVLWTSRDVKRFRGDCSDMTLWRDIKRGILPEPLKINGRNHWWRSAVRKAYGQQAASA